LVDCRGTERSEFLTAGTSELTAFWVGVIAGYGIAIPVGAIAVLIVQVGMRCGFRCGASAGAGAATADLLYSVLAVTGGAALAGAVDSIGKPLRWVSAGVLIAIAALGLYRVRREPPGVQTTLPGRKEYAGTYAKFVGLTIINPLTVVYFAAFVLGLGLAEGLSVAEGALFVTGAFLASLSWQTVLAGIGALAHRRLPRRFQVSAIMVGNLIVLAMAALIIIR
jgi:threonine/homoserine/homoserine lactone efflux protein